METRKSNGAADGDTAMYQRIGQLTRSLHEALHELGYDRELEAAAQSLPDARDRLSYIAALTGQAANRVLGAVERAQAEQDAIDAQARELAEQLRGAASAKNSCVVEAMSAFIDALPARTAATRSELLDIMMAQDFHDLTGQVIKRVADVAQRLEASLVALLLETCPRVAPASEPSLGGPAVRPNADTVENQDQVDQLLESLGF